MNKINLYYKHLNSDGYPIHPNGLDLNESWYGHHSIGFSDYSFLNFYNIHNLKYFNYTNNLNEKSILPINILKNPNYWFNSHTTKNELISIFNKLPLEQIRRGTIKLFIYDGHEGNNYLNFLQEYYAFFTEMEIPLNNIIFGSANYTMLDNFKNHPHYQFNSFEFFFLNYFMLNAYSLKDDNNSFLSNINNTKRQYKILSLNRIPKLHRALLTLFLYTYKDTLAPLFSLPGDKSTETGRNMITLMNDIKNNCKKIPKKYREKLLTNIDNMIDDMPFVIDRSDFDTNFYDVYSKEMYENSYFNLVNETLFYEKELFLSEKIFKPILNYQPFIIAGSAGVLNSLRKVGFETFPELFDESYDNIKDNTDRIEKIMDILSQLAEFPLETVHKKYIDQTDKLIYNKKLITENNIENPLNDIYTILESFYNGKPISNPLPRYFK